MEHFTPGSALIGGLLIGLSANLMLLLNGRVAGISGILDGAFQQGSSERSLRWLFLIGLGAGGALLSLLYPTAFSGAVNVGIPLTITAGLLVGFGTRLGSGCTSGHGVCGLSRFSKRSLFATCVFMGAGFGIATLFHGLLEVAL